MTNPILVVLIVVLLTNRIRDFAKLPPNMVQENHVICIEQRSLESLSDPNGWTGSHALVITSNCLCF